MVELSYFLFISGDEGKFSLSNLFSHKFAMVDFFFFQWVSLLPGSKFDVPLNKNDFPSTVVAETE